jgi:hypothetical protein
MIKTTALALASALVLFGAGADASETESGGAAQPLVVEVAANAVNAGGLTRWSTAFAAGDPVVKLDTGAACADDRAGEWSELLTRRVGTELKAALRAELAHGSNGAGSALAGLQFKAVVNDVQMQVCRVGTGAWQGGFQVRVTWTVQAPGASRPLYQGSTRGAYLSAQVQTRPAAQGLREAMAAAAHALLSDQRLVAATVAEAKVSAEPVRIAAAD